MVHGVIEEKTLWKKMASGGKQAREVRRLSNF